MENFSIYARAKRDIAYSFALFLLFWIFDFTLLSYIAFACFVASFYIFRDPQRKVLSHEDGKILSPVDGEVVSLEHLEDEIFGTKVEINSKCFDMGVFYAPMRSTLKELKIVKGAKLPSSDPKFKKLNENVTLLLEDEKGRVLKINHLSRFNCKEIDIDLFVKQKLDDATVYGFMLSGITTIYFPKDAKIDLNVGSRVVASQTIGYF